MPGATTDEALCRKLATSTLWLDVRTEITQTLRSGDGVRLNSVHHLAERVVLVCQPKLLVSTTTRPPLGGLFYFAIDISFLLAVISSKQGGLRCRESKFL